MTGSHIITSGISTDQLLELIRLVTREEVQTAVKQLQGEEKFITVNEVCKLFEPEISRVTVYRWTKEGILIPHIIGGKTYYLKSEVFAASTALKKYDLKRA